MEAIDCAHIKQLLTQSPTGVATVDYFCCFLAGRLTGKVDPMGFLMAYCLAAGDLDRGKDGFTGNPIDHRLARTGVGYALSLSLPRVASKVLPPSFSAEVVRLYREL